MIESLLLSVTRVTTLLGTQLLTNATGFFFHNEERLFLITSRHVVLDENSNHRPDGLAIDLHIDPENVVSTTQFFIPLDNNNQPLWREAPTQQEQLISSPWRFRDLQVQFGSPRYCATLSGHTLADKK
jgi:hypothetical protein